MKSREQETSSETIVLFFVFCERNRMNQMPVRKQNKMLKERWHEEADALASKNMKMIMKGNSNMLENFQRGVEGAIGRSKSNLWSGQISSDMAKSDVTLNEYFGGISQEAHYKLLPPKTTDYTTYTLLLAPAGWLAGRLDGIPSRFRGRYWRNRLHICLVTRSYQTKFCLSGR